jgi:hypothetical protein
LTLRKPTLQPSPNLKIETPDIHHSIKKIAQLRPLIALRGCPVWAPLVEGLSICRSIIEAVPSGMWWELA